MVKDARQWRRSISVPVVLLAFAFATGLFVVKARADLVRADALRRNRGKVEALATREIRVRGVGGAEHLMRVKEASFDEEIEIDPGGGGGSTQWCWKRTCVHDSVTCDGGTSTDVNGCSVRCSWSDGVSATWECPPR